MARKPVGLSAPHRKEAKKPEPTYAMPMEVKNWIDQASSRIAHMTSEIERLKAENKQLRLSNKRMEQRVMGTSVE